MATWPTEAEIQTAWSKLNQPALLNKVTRSRQNAINEIKAAMASLYDASPWTDVGTVTPPALVELAFTLAYGHANRATHTGDRMTPSDQTGKDALEDARDLLKLYSIGARDLVDDAGNLYPQRSFTTGLTRPPLISSSDSCLANEQSLCGCGVHHVPTCPQWV